MKKNIIQLFSESVKAYSSNAFLMQEKDGKYKSLSYTEVEYKVRCFASGLLGIGVNKGDRIGLLAEGQSNWTISELGVLFTGAICVPLSIKLVAGDLAFRINHSECSILIVSKQQFKKIQDIKEQLPTVKEYIFIEDTPSNSMDGLDFQFLVERGNEYLSKNSVALESRISEIQPEDPANISYTSGTTANPKGIILSHYNYVCNAEQAVEHVKGFHFYFRTLLILPWDHSFGHTAGIFAFMKNGAAIASVTVGDTPMQTLRNVARNLKQINPHTILTVPYLAANFRKNIEYKIRKKGKLLYMFFKFGLRISYVYNKEGYNKGRGLSIFLKPIVYFYKLLIFRQIHNSFASNLRYFIGGGALLDIDLQRFFYAIGMPIYQGYGLSEASPIISANTPREHKLGSSGKILPNIKLRIVDDEFKDLPIGEKGEIIIQGDNVMQGYWKNNEATRQTIINGWLHTGDLGYLDRDGYLYVLGRRKSLLISSDGEKFSPEEIEEAIVEHSKYINQCILYNNQKPYTVALITINKDILKKSVKDAEDATKCIASQIQDFKNNKNLGGRFPQQWLPLTYVILEEPFTEDNTLVNSTLKIVRHRVYERYNEQIMNLYKANAKDNHQENTKALNNILIK